MTPRGCGGRARAVGLAIVPLLFLLSSCGVGDYEPRDGDIVFHASRSSQSAAIQRATRSRYSHMGIVYVEDGRPFVFEAIQPVASTPLAQWIRRGEGGHFVVKRLRDADRLLTPDALARMKAEGLRFRGKDYDLTFEWSDERIYCSELVWKIYRRALGVEVGRTATLADFDLSDPVVRAKVRERWHGSPPMDERVISPAAMFASDRLMTVYSR